MEGQEVGRVETLQEAHVPATVSEVTLNDAIVISDAIASYLKKNPKASLYELSNALERAEIVQGRKTQMKFLLQTAAAAGGSLVAVAVLVYFLDEDKHGASDDARPRPTIGLARHSLGDRFLPPGGALLRGVRQGEIPSSGIHSASLLLDSNLFIGEVTPV